MKIRSTGRNRLLVGLAASTLFLTACAGGNGGSAPDPAESASDPTEGDPITIVATSGFSDGHLDTIALKAMADYLAEVTEGRITIDFHSSGSLHTAVETADAVADGISNLSFHLPVYEPARFPLSNWASGLVLTQTPTLPAGFLGFAAAQAEWAYGQDYILEEYEAAGLKILSNPTIAPTYTLACTTPVASLDEAAGKRVRVPGSLWAASIEAIGMVPVQMSGAEVYEGLQRGVIDCTASHARDLIPSKTVEVAKEFTELPLPGWNQYYLIVGLDFWEGLSEADQELIWNAQRVWYETFYGGLQAGHFLFWEEAEANGVNINVPDREMLNAVIQANKDNLAATLTSAPDGLDDPGAVADQLKDLNDEWNRTVVDLGYGEYPSTVEWIEAVEDGDAPGLEPWLDALLNDVIIPNRK